MPKSHLIFSRYSPRRQERRRKQLAFASGAGVCVLLIGATLMVTTYRNNIRQWALGLPFQEQAPLLQGESVDTPVLQLMSLAPSERRTQLEATALQPKSLNRSRARYLLAVDLIEQKQPEKAIAWLEGLEWEYPVLAPHIALKRAQAYELTGNKAKARLAWQELLKRYPDNPVAAEAIYALSTADPNYWKTGKSQYLSSNILLDTARHWYAFSANDPQYWQRALEKFPSHPRILEIARQRLKHNPDQPQLLLILAKYAFDSPDMTSVLDQLVNRYGKSSKKKERELITPEVWEAIANGYWHTRHYTQASLAYTKAPKTARNAYLSALALEYAHKLRSAKQAYQQMMGDFPDSEETATALLNMAKIERSAETLPYLDYVIDQFPAHAGEAVLARSEILNRMGNTQTSVEMRELLLSKYGNSDAAAEYRWRMAQTRARSGDIQAAFEWAQPILAENPHSEPAREAGFWVGKWANHLGLRKDAKAAFQQVIAQHPYSYYAWRSAVHLGWDVGDFTTVRKIDPEVVKPAARPELPIGSPALKELYRLGQDRDAWMLWQAEFQNRLQPTVAEQFTDGILKIAVGDYLEGIDQLAKLENRDTPEEKAQYQALQQKLVYWQALYPLAFVQLIEEQSQKRDLNPLLVTALIRQESRFEPDIRSHAGAVGLMQMMPKTGAWAAQHTNMKDYSLENPDDNIKLGTWFLDQIHRSFKDNSLLAVASYNAGQGNTTKWLRHSNPVDPDEFVESIPFDETRDYVKQVFGNYWNYLRLYDPQVSQQLAKHASTPSLAMRR
jgi:soluble lytic murein transglycosylase